jgi:hypothetical protein
LQTVSLATEEIRIHSSSGSPSSKNWFQFTCIQSELAFAAIFNSYVQPILPQLFVDVTESRITCSWPVGVGHQFVKRIPVAKNAICAFIYHNIISISSWKHCSTFPYLHSQLPPDLHPHSQWEYIPAEPPPVSPLSHISATDLLFQQPL